MAKLHLGYSAGLGGALFWACSTGGDGGLALVPPAQPQGGNSSVFTSDDGSTSTGSVPINTQGPTPDSGIVYRRPKVCDANGENCKCLNLASFGARASQAYGTGSDGQPSSTTSFEAWLTDKSNAVVTFVLNYQPLTPEYLAGFDVIMLQDLRTWNLSATDIQNLGDWVNGGGGLIALNGYMNTDDAEVTATNRAIAFTGLTYNGGGTNGSVPQQVCPIYAKQFCPQSNSCTSLQCSCCYCWNNTVPLIEWDTSSPIAKSITAIGAAYGRSVNPGDGQVVLKYQGTPVAASRDIGTGKVFVYGDEWVTYTSVWSGGYVNAAVNSPDQLQYEECYDPTQSWWATADHVFQTKQFWYNAIHYVSPPTECDFVIKEPEVKIVIL